MQDPDQESSLLLLSASLIPGPLPVLTSGARLTHSGPLLLMSQRWPGQVWPQLSAPRSLTDAAQGQVQAAAGSQPRIQC